MKSDTLSTTGIAVEMIQGMINLSKLISDMEKYPDKKIERILKEFRKTLKELRKLSAPATEEDIKDILKTFKEIVSKELDTQKCEVIEVWRFLGIERRRVTVRGHFY